MQLQTTQSLGYFNSFIHLLYYNLDHLCKGFNYHSATKHVNWYTITQASNSLLGKKLQTAGSCGTQVCCFKQNEFLLLFPCHDAIPKAIAVMAFV